MNKALTAANEKAVLELVQDSAAKNRFKALSYLHNKAYATRAIAHIKSVPQSTVRAAAYYW
jgi:predicted transcriptional regulator